MTTSYYIYYRVDAGKAEACSAAVDGIFAAIRETTGIAGRLLRKRGEPLLWMEIYEYVADEAQFEWELAEAVGKMKFMDLLQPGSGRHVECFTE